ncbi:MAG: SRPBCC family protein [Candidatus Dormibacteraeota bacterium]|nr:SRPBCC family protein [Candidatus Dormibacteraeota bacterium]
MQNTLTSSQQVYQLFIKASPEQIWDSITKPEFTAKYFFGAHVETTAEVGSPFRHHSPDRSSLWGDETVLESEPPRRLVVTWRSLYDPELAGEPPSRVSWDIEAQEGGFSKLTVSHDHLEGSPKTAESVSGAGWMMVLSGLKTVLETGRPLTDG